MIRRVILCVLILFSGILFSKTLILQMSPQASLQSDFIAFFTAAKMVASGAASHLYDLDIQAAFQKEIIGPYRHELLPYFHPPFQIIAYLPLTVMPLRWAYQVWMIISLGIITVALIAFRSYFRPVSRAGRQIMWLACFSFLPTAAIFIMGQDTAISLLIFTLVFLNIKKGNEGKAGAILALGLFKPHLVGITAIILLFKRRWRAFGWFCLTGAVLLFVSLLMVGWQGAIDYIKLIPKVATWEDQYGVFPSKMHNLKAFFYLVFGSDQKGFIITALTLTSLGFFTLLVLIWKGKWDPSSYLFDLKFSVLIMVTLMTSPHLNTYDLALWIIPGILVCHYLSRERPKIKVYLLEALLPFGYMAGLYSLFYLRPPHFPASVVFMAAVVALLSQEISLIKRDKAGNFSDYNGFRGGVIPKKRRIRTKFKENTIEIFQSVRVRFTVCCQ